MNITLTNQVQRLKQQLAQYVEACVLNEQVAADAAHYFLEALETMPTTPNYTLSGLPGVGKTAIIDMLLGRIAAKCPEGTVFIHEHQQLDYPEQTFLHDIDTLENCILQLKDPQSISTADDFILWVTQYGNIGQLEEINHLKTLHAQGKKIICLINMVDIHEQLTEEPLFENLAAQMKPISSYVHHYYALSAAYAKAAQEFYDDDLYSKSGFHELEYFLEANEFFYLEQMKQCWELFEPFTEYIEAMLQTSFKDITGLINQFEYTLQQTVDEQYEQLYAPLQQFLPSYTGNIRQYMFLPELQQPLLKQLTLQLETLLAMPASIQEIEDIVEVLIAAQPVIFEEHHVYKQLQGVYNDCYTLLEKFARQCQEQQQQQWQQEQAVMLMQHEEIQAYQNLTAFHEQKLAAIEQLFGQSFALEIPVVEQPRVDVQPLPTIVSHHFELPFSFEDLLVQYIDIQTESFFSEVEQHLEASDSILDEMTHIAQSANDDELMMQQFHEKLEQVQTINELLLIFDDQLKDYEDTEQRFVLFHELVENYRVMQAKIDVYDEQALQSLAQHTEMYTAIVAQYRHLQLLTNSDKRELRAIVQDYNGIQAFRQQQYEELGRAYEDLEHQCSEYKQMLIHEYDAYMKRYKEQLQQRESVMQEWQNALIERQGTLMKRDRLRALQKLQTMAATSGYEALQPIVARIATLLKHIEQLYDYELPNLPTYSATQYQVAAIKQAALPVEQENPVFLSIDVIPTKYEVVPYRGIMTTTITVVTVALLFGVIYGILYATGMVETPINELFSEYSY